MGSSDLAISLSDNNSWLYQIKRLQDYLNTLHQQNNDLYPTAIFIIALETDNRFLISLFILSTWKLPICLFPISTSYSDEYKNQLLKQCGVRIVFTDRTYIDNYSYTLLPIKKLLHALTIQLKQLPELIDFQSIDQQLKAEEVITEKEKLPKLIITTTGTTNKPKAVYLSKQNIICHCQASREIIEVNTQSIWLNCLPLNHVAGLMILYRAMFVKASVLLQDKFFEERVFQLIEEFHITHLSLVPTMLQKLFDAADKIDGIILPLINNIKYLLLGGSKLTKKLLNQAKQSHIPIVYGYGASESCSHITLTGKDTLNTLLTDKIVSTKQEQLFFEKNIVSSGKALKGVEIRIKPSDSSESVGLIQFRGDMIMEGYANSNYLLGQGKDKGWFSSNDLGYINSHGHLFVLGRKDQIINSGGEKINPQIVEQMLSTCPGIENVTIYAIKDTTWEQIIGMDYCGRWSEVLVANWIKNYIKSPYKPRKIKKVTSVIKSFKS